MSPSTKKVAIFYATWVLLCLFLSGIDYGDSKAGHLLLVVSGLPLALLSLHIVPNGSVFATFVAGLIGWLQWCAVAEVNARWNTWRQPKETKTVNE